MSAKSQLKKNRNIFILVCFYGLFLSAQEDSARYYLKSKLPIITRIQKCMKAAYLTMNYETSVTFYNKLTALPEIGQNPEYLCMAANELANNAGELGKLNEATAIMKDAVEKTKDQLSDTTAANSYYFLSYLYFSIGDYEPAVSTCFTSLQYSEKSGNKRLIGAAYNNLGLIYSEKSSPDFKKALEYFLISEKLLKPFKHPVTMGLVYLRIGDVLSMQNEYAQAEKYFAKALRIGDSCNRVSIQKWTLEKYGKMLRRMGNRLRALEMMNAQWRFLKETRSILGKPAHLMKLPLCTWN
jgi:tetratricopeptide (TPR) repeat protein